LGLIPLGSTIVVQRQTSSQQFVEFTVAGEPIIFDNQFVSIAVTPVDSLGANFATGDLVYALVAYAGAQGQQGSPGPAGAGFNYRGLYTQNTTYFKNDVVSFNTAGPDYGYPNGLYAGTYVCTSVSVSNVDPPLGSPWVPMALSGANGATGPQGPQGPVGPQGPAGSGVGINGFYRWTRNSPLTSGWYNDGHLVIGWDSTSNEVTLRNAIPKTGVYAIGLTNNGGSFPQGSSTVLLANTNRDYYFQSGVGQVDFIVASDNDATQPFYKVRVVMTGSGTTALIYGVVTKFT
jgi:hypothetical protein